MLLALTQPCKYVVLVHRIIFIVVLVLLLNMCIVKEDSQSPQKEAQSPRSPWMKLLNRQVRIDLYSQDINFYVFLNVVYYILVVYRLWIMSTNYRFIDYRAQNQGFHERWQAPHEWIWISAGRNLENWSPTLHLALTCHRIRLLISKNRSWCRSPSTSIQ